MKAHKAWAIAACLALSGCATLNHGGTQDIEVTSEPSGALVWVDSAEIGHTPLKVPVRRGGADVRLRIESAGYKPDSVQLSRRIGGWVVGDLLLGADSFFGAGLGSGPTAGVIVGVAFTAFSIGFDYATGAIYNRRPKALHIALEPAEK
jgi:PEGA domain.